MEEDRALASAVPPLTEGGTTPLELGLADQERRTLIEELAAGATRPDRHRPRSPGSGRGCPGPLDGLRLPALRRELLLQLREGAGSPTGRRRRSRRRAARQGLIRFLRPQRPGSISAMQSGRPSSMRCFARISSPLMRMPSANMIPLGAGSTTAWWMAGSSGSISSYGEVPVDRLEAAAGAAVLVRKPGSHRRVERLAIDAVERAPEHAVTAVEQREAEIALLHAARIGLRDRRAPASRAGRGRSTSPPCRCSPGPRRP